MSQKNGLLNDQKASLVVTSDMAIQCMHSVLASRITRIDEICVIHPNSKGRNTVIFQRNRKRNAFGAGHLINEASRAGLFAHPEGLGDPPVDPPKTK